MRFVSLSYGLLAAGALAYGCTVYDSGLTTSGELTGGGDSGSAAQGGSSSSDGGKSSMTAGTFSTTAGTQAQAGSTATGGTAPTMSDGGMGNEGGENPASSGSSTGGGGAGGSGGTSGGTGGKGGTGGTGGGGTGGGGGSGGSAPVVKCADHPITAKATWVATASSASLGNGMETDGLYNPPEHMTDGNYSERWSSGKKQDGTEWIQIDFGATVNLTGITLNVNNDTGDYPRHYEVRLTKAADPTFKGTVLVADDGMPGNTVVLFKGIVSGRYLTVRQTTALVDGPWWTIAEVLATCSDP